jgi:hypothetical protein
VANQRDAGYFSLLDTSLPCELCVSDHYLAEIDNFYPETAVERKETALFDETFDLDRMELTRKLLITRGIF